MADEQNVGWTEALGAEGGNPSQPRTSGEVIHALGGEWRVSACENRIKAQYEQWVRSNAARAVQEVEAEEGPDSASQMRSAYLADRGAGHYNWDGRHCRSARGDVPGITYLLFLLLRRCQPDMDLETATRVFEAAPRDCAAALRWALGNSQAPPSSGANPTTADPKKTLAKTLDR